MAFCPENLHGDEYFNGLAELQEEAFVHSTQPPDGLVLGIGLISVGLSNIKARWHSISDGLADLTDTRLIYGSRERSLIPAVLYVADPEGESGVIMTQYKIDLARRIIRVRHSLGPDSTWQYHRGAKKDSKQGLDVPTDEDLVRLYQELDRGASGDFRDTEPLEY